MTISNHTITTLITNAGKGDLPAQEALYHQYCRAMYNLCIRMCGNEDDANDMLQEGFITAFDKIHQLKEAPLFGGWLKRIMINQCLLHSKRKIIYSSLLSVDIDRAEEADENWWATISMAQIHEAIKQLPEGCRQIFVLYAVEDYTHNQIAKELQVNVGTSKSQYSRAKQLLRKIIIKKMVKYG